MYSYGRASSSIPWVSLIMAVGVIALMIAAQWRLFTKAGEPGWKSIVPIYGAYTLYKLVWTPGAFAVFAALSAAFSAAAFFWLATSAFVCLLTSFRTLLTTRAFSKTRAL